METLDGFEKKYLRGLAHKIKPVVFVGQKGLTDTLLRSVDQALNRHELIKIKFVDFKEKALKQQIAAEIETKAGCHMAGMIGHTAILYRRHTDPDQRKIKLPRR